MRTITYLEVCGLYNAVLLMQGILSDIRNLTVLRLQLLGGDALFSAWKTQRLTKQSRQQCESLQSTRTYIQWNPQPNLGFHKTAVFSAAVHNSSSLSIHP